MAVAWAKDNGHSAPLGLTWNVWNSNAKDFVSDANLMATQQHSKSVEWCRMHVLRFTLNG